jgi:hypothetical protein
MSETSLRGIRAITVFMARCGVGYAISMFPKIMEAVVESGLREIMGKKVTGKGACD